MRIRGSILFLALTLVAALVGYARANSIVAWGDNTYGQVSGAPTGKNFTAIAGGYGTGYALTANGSIVAWGNDSYGQMSNAPTGTGFTAIAAFENHAYALTSNGSIVAWGSDSYGQTSTTPKGTGYTAIAASMFDGYALKSDGSIVAWGDNTYGEKTIPTISPSGTAVQITATMLGAGGNDAYAASPSGYYPSTGSTFYGAMGWGENASPDYLTYGITSNTRNILCKMVAGGYFNGYVLTTTGSIEAWGDNTYNQITFGFSSPAQNTGFLSIAGGSYTTYALTGNHTIKVWGNNTFDQVSDAPTWNTIQAIAAGTYTGYALSAPEPNSLAILALGGIGLLAFRRRRTLA